MSSLIASSSSPQTNYDVFLSFSGETRYNFTAHLHKALCQKGIHTFLDDDELERGETIPVELLKAIEGSRCSVVILSEDYASSRWCLDELVKILQCRKELKQIVLPIFYHMDPSHVRGQNGSIGDAFQRHEQDFSHNLQKVTSWRAACTEVGNLVGEHLQDDRNEAEFIEDFIMKVSSKLYVPLLNVSKDLVGMNSRLEELESCVSGSPDVRVIGICGMGGLGKTTLARAYFEHFSDQFDASSFLANVREICEKEHDGLAKLQKQLLTDILKGEHRISDVERGRGMIRRSLCWKKVLVILDDVDKLEQLEGLAENFNWFAYGSRIIVTTRDEGLLSRHGEDGSIIHRLDKLKDIEALHLFSLKAFKCDCAPEDYKELSEEVSKYANGLPLTLVVLGSFLLKKSLNQWKSVLDRLKEYSNKDILKALQISFDGLEDTEKSIFLDIACFFNGSRRDYIMEIMDSCGFFPEIGISILVDKSLVHIDNDDKVRMHDLLEELGKEIVREKSRHEPGSRSRIWLWDDVSHVMNNETGTEEVEAIVCRSRAVVGDLSLGGFSNMKNLRLLIAETFVDECRNLVHLSNELRFLEWSGFPLNSFPLSFKPYKLVELKLYKSKIEQLWNNPMKPLNNLKYINLSHSSIRKLECFSLFPNLEKLILNHCYNLEEICPSITVLKRLTLLNLEYCTGLKSLPTSMDGLESLKVLMLAQCSSRGNLPKDLGCLNNLEKLDVSGLRDIPSSIGDLKALKSLTCYGVILESRGWRGFFYTIVGNGLSSAGLYSLEKLDLSNCNLRDSYLPYDFGCLVSLKYLDLSRNKFSCLPACFNQLSKLKDLDLSNCINLKSLGPELPDSLEMVRVNSCSELHTFLDPSSQCNLRCSAFCEGCFKLINRQGSKRTAITSLGRYLQNPHSACKRFDIALPGVEIPSWFTHQDRGSSSISLPLNPNWCTNKWMGFALSVCCTSRDRSKVNDEFSSEWSWEIKINQQDWGFGPVSFEGRFIFIEARHLWLLYLPRDTYFLTEWQNKFGHIRFSHDIHPVRNVKCGARLVYEHDIEELNLMLKSEEEELNLSL